MSFVEVQESRPKRVARWNIWLRRLIVSCGVVLVVGLSLFFYARSRVTAYTSERPVSLPKVTVSKDRMVALEKRLGRITTSVEAGSTLSGEFSLTSEEINALVHKEPKLRDKVFIKFQDGKLKADVSFPADVMPGGQGRYFNAEVTLEVSVADGVLQVYVSDAIVDEAPIPDMWMKLVRDRNFAKPLYNDREISQILANVNQVDIDGDSIVFKLKGAANEKQIALQARRADRRVQVH